MATSAIESKGKQKASKQLIVSQLVIDLQIFPWLNLSHF